MEATALVLLAAVGVGYGWQPMPDGSSRYEYVVQIEPELLATLGEDGSIPIVSEVPEDIRPIGRIRVVVGRGDLPRERLVKRMKPAGEGAVELAQYNQFGAPAERYGQPGAASPDASSWNGGAGDSAALATPDSGAGASWNNAPISVAERTTEQGPMARVGDHIDDATAPLRQGLEKVDDGVRTAVGNLGDRTRNLVDELGRPFQPRPNQPDNRAPVGTNPNVTTAPTWNGGDAAGVPTLADDAAASRYDGQSNSWNGSDAASLPEAPAFAGASPGAAGPGAGQPNSGSADWNAPGPAGAGASQRLDQPIDPRDVGRWDNAAPSAPASGTNAAPPLVGRGGANPDNIDYRRQADAARQSPGADDNPAGFPADWARSGQRSPSFDNSPDANAAAPRADAVAREPTDATSPKIDSRMLQQPASRPLEGTDSARAAASNIAGPEFPAAGQRPATNSPQTPAARPAGANGQGWDLPTRGAADQQAGAQTPASGSGRQTVAALFAWVLLTSSAAGNLYLFWSYQDVRHKYRALVRKTARAVGSRLSAA